MLCAGSRDCAHRPQETAARPRLSAAHVGLEISKWGESGELGPGLGHLPGAEPNRYSKASAIHGTLYFRDAVNARPRESADVATRRDGASITPGAPWHRELEQTALS